MTTVALIVAAGRGSRAAETGCPVPKQYQNLAGVPLLRHTLQPFIGHEGIDTVAVVIRPEDRAHYDAAVMGLGGKLLEPIAGGQTRQASVRLGLEALAHHNPERVLIHDAARPFVAPETMTRVIAALAVEAGAIAAIPLADTLKRAASDGTISQTPDRHGLWRAQTPQGFQFEAILKAHRAAAAARRDDFTDDAAIGEWAGLRVVLVEDRGDNVKLTTPDDLDAADRRLARDMAQYETRVASGFDVHKFAPGDHVWLGGVKIPHTHKLDGHSDADVVLHALTDALLGCIGDGDIGQHFPPSEPQWKGAASRLFLKDAARRVAERGGRIVNVDVTILAEAPKIGPHRVAIQAAIGIVLGLAPDRVGVKATTTEGLGFTGRREGIAAMATATVELPQGRR